MFQFDNHRPVRDSVDPVKGAVDSAVNPVVGSADYEVGSEVDPVTHPNFHHELYPRLRRGPLNNKKFLSWIVSVSMSLLTLSSLAARFSKQIPGE